MTATARDGGQTVTVKEALAAGLQRRYKITAANAKPMVDYDTVVDNTTSGANARARGEATLPAPAPPAGG
ncbi:hypothetical protein [Bifidobacterium breve]|uniref:hypothetical protein n=1 Tax=Bifidobacterium breve TaxID=1685 RepID=UPI0022AEDB6A|nr:hypothetical protein [Bifidobacterium breve]MCZ4443939.1 hypothetical protein [Bifidobacterium breve]MCZ4444952.1 hypothetical protein [Bifidobacterium breve]MCZ4452702.1 hypothetical protein [Bifidobacterium breve]